VKKVDPHSFISALVLGLIISPFWFWALDLYRDGGVISTRLVQRVPVEPGGWLELGLLIFLSLFFIPCTAIVVIVLLQFSLWALRNLATGLIHLLSPMWQLVNAVRQDAIPFYESLGYRKIKSQTVLVKSL
jgi:hypothetical protein